MNRSTKVLLYGVALVVFGLSLSAGPTFAQDAAALYKAKCASCHGTDGKGKTGAGKALGAHDFSSEDVQRLSDAELTEVIAKG